MSESLVRFIPRLIRRVCSFRGLAGLVAALFVSAFPATAHAVSSVTTLSITPSTTVTAGTVITMTANNTPTATAAGSTACKATTATIQGACPRTTGSFIRFFLVLLSRLSANAHAISELPHAHSLWIQDRRLQTVQAGI